MPVKSREVKGRKSSACNAIVAEPRHRTGGSGMTSGISLRNPVKTSPMQAVKDICQHYVLKCSGKYEDNKMAARYVHQMADEVLKQLGSADIEMKRYENDILVYEQLVQQWKENFPQSLGDMNMISPKTLAETLKKQTRDLFELQKELDRVKDLHVSDVQYIMNSTDAQLQAARVSVIAERKQQNQAHTSQNEYYENLMKNKEKQYSTSMEELAKFYENQLVQLKKFYDGNLQDIQDQLTMVQRRETETNLHHKNTIDKMNAAHEHHMQDMNSKLHKSQQLVEKLMAEDDEESETIGSIASAELGGIRRYVNQDGRPGKQSTGKRMRNLRKEDLIQEIRALSDVKIQNDKDIKDISSQLSIAIEEIDYLKRKINDFEELNETLRKALNQNLYGKSDAEDCDRTISSGINPVPLLKFGNIFKQGRFVKNWKLRQFVLAAGQLCDIGALKYFENELYMAPYGDKKLGEITFLKGMNVSVNGELVTISSDMNASTGASNEAKGYMVLRIAEVEERSDWVHALRHHIEFANNSRMLCWRSWQGPGLKCSRLYHTFL